MNIRNTTFSLIVATSLGVAFTQNANARDDYQDNMSGDRERGMRITFAPNIIHGATSHRAVSPISVGPQEGAMPKSNMLGLDPNFVKKTPPPPIAKAMPAMPVPAVQAQVVQKPSIMPDALKSIFGNPTPQTPLIAQGAQPLPTPAAAKPATAPRVTTDGRAKLLHHNKPVARMAAPSKGLPAIAGYPGGYTPTPNLPSVAVGGQSGASASVAGRVIQHH